MILEVCDQMGWYAQGAPLSGSSPEASALDVANSARDQT